MSKQNKTKQMLGLSVDFNRGGLQPYSWNGNKLKTGLGFGPTPKMTWAAFLLFVLLDRTFALVQYYWGRHGPSRDWLVQGLLAATNQEVKSYHQGLTQQTIGAATINKSNMSRSRQKQNKNKNKNKDRDKTNTKPNTANNRDRHNHDVQFEESKHYRSKR